MINFILREHANCHLDHVPCIKEFQSTNPHQQLNYSKKFIFYDTITEATAKQAFQLQVYNIIILVFTDGLVPSI